MDPAFGIARLLLDTPGAVKITESDRFEFASGLRSPLYLDCRTLVSQPDTRREVTGHLAEAARALPRFDAVVGVATGGIPWGAWLSEALELPFAYVRPAAKDRGTRQAVEGSLATGSEILVVEDLITTGGSSLKCVEGMAAAGFRTTAVLSIFSYDLSCAEELFERSGVRLESLCRMPDLLAPAAEDPRWAGAVDMLGAWHRDEARTFRPGV